MPKLRLNFIFSARLNVFVKYYQRLLDGAIKLEQGHKDAADRHELLWGLLSTAGSGIIPRETVAKTRLRGQAFKNSSRKVSVVNR